MWAHPVPSEKSEFTHASRIVNPAAHEASRPCIVILEEPTPCSFPSWGRRLLPGSTGLHLSLWGDPSCPQLLPPWMSGEDISGVPPVGSVTWAPSLPVRGLGGPREAVEAACPEPRGPCRPSFRSCSAWGSGPPLPVGQGSPWTPGPSRRQSGDFLSPDQTDFQRDPPL